MAYTLSLDECIGLTASLNKAVSSKDHGALKDMLASLKVADTKNKLKNISESKLGQTIAKLGKYDVDAEVKAMALEIKKMWAARAAAAKPAAAKPEGVKSEVKAEATASAPAAPAAPTAEVKEEVKPEVKAEEAAASSGVPEPVKLERRDSLSHVDWRPAAPTGDTVRDMVRTKLQEAFDKGKAENEKFLHEQVVDTAGMAELAENKMFETFDGVSKEYKARFRSLSFNLKDPKNPHFIKAIITGQVFVTDLATMEVREMASEEMKKARFDAAEHAKMALMDERAYKNYKGIATQDGILKCPKCKSMKTEYVEVQTRSADEPTTKKCICNNCDYRWKFC